MAMQKENRWWQYYLLMRLDKPIGTMLLLWPTLWGLWLANPRTVPPFILFIFMSGVLIMRSAGCVANDIADRHFDAHVARTTSRPLASGAVSVNSALLLLFLLLLVAAALAWQLNNVARFFACLGALWAVIYPLLKRVMPLPQAGLGVAFSWGIPMAFAASIGYVPMSAWVLFAAASIWPVIYDTFYAMVDKQDDLKIGVQSAAIMFGRHDKIIIAVLQLCFVALMIAVMQLNNLPTSFAAAIGLVSCLFLYQQWLIQHRDPANCYAAFMNNNWVGFIIFCGILAKSAA